MTSIREINAIATDTRSGAVNAGISGINTFLSVQNQNLGSSNGAITNDNYFAQDFENPAMGVDSDGLVGSSLSFYQIVSGTRTVQGQLNELGGTWTLAYANGVASLAYEVAPVPLPAAAWLLISGLVGLAGVSRRKSA